MIPIQKITIYALMGTATIILLSSSVRIGVSIIGEALSSTTTTVDYFDVDIDEEDDTANSRPNEHNEPILPTTIRKLAADKGEGVRDVLPKLLFQMSKETRKIDESKLPYKCGVILYYHVPGTGGKAIHDWMKTLAENNLERASFFSSEGLDSPAFINGVNDQIGNNIGSNEQWKFIYAHDNSISFHENRDIVNQWRQTVENQKCQFLITTTFQDPMDHSISHTKKEFAKCNCNNEDFKPFIKQVLESEPWRGQLDYLLFNTKELTEEEYWMSMKDKVKRGIQLLQQHFDLVIVDDHDKFASTILKVTGWASAGEMAEKVLSDSKDLVYSKELVSAWGKMSAKNGDADFVDAVNHIFGGSLDYLMMQ